VFIKGIQFFNLHCGILIPSNNKQKKKYRKNNQYTYQEAEIASANCNSDNHPSEKSYKIASSSYSKPFFLSFDLHLLHLSKKKLKRTVLSLLCFITGVATELYKVQKKLSGDRRQ
jgi:hypothetical protein